jgi:hypothetical protein
VPCTSGHRRCSARAWAGSGRPRFLTSSWPKGLEVKAW